MDLDAPVSRLTMPDVPSPHNPVLLDHVVPSVERIRAKIDDAGGILTHMADILVPFEQEGTKAIVRGVAEEHRRPGGGQRPAGRTRDRQGHPGSPRRRGGSARRDSARPRRRGRARRGTGAAGRARRSGSGRPRRRAGGSRERPSAFGRCRACARAHRFGRDVGGKRQQTMARCRLLSAARWPSTASTRRRSQAQGAADG